MLAVLPTEYGKSLIFQLFSVPASIGRKERQTVLFVCHLKSIIEDQIAKAERMVNPAASDITEKELCAAKFQLIFGSAEKVMDRRFFDILKDNSSSLHRQLAAVVVDEPILLRCGLEKSLNKFSVESDYQESRYLTIAS